MKCEEKNIKSNQIVLYTTGGILALSTAVSAVFIPVLYKVQNKTRRVFTICQQICVIGYLVSVMLFHGVFAWDFVYQVYLSHHFLHSDPARMTLVHVLMCRKLIEFFRTFFYYGFHYFSLMQSFDLYTMICDPLKYSDFCETRCIMKYVSFGFIFCVVISCDHLSAIIVATVRIWAKLAEYHWHHSRAYHTANEKIGIFTLVKTILVKIVYVGCISRMSLLIWKALQKSNDLNRNDKKREVH